MSDGQPWPFRVAVLSVIVVLVAVLAEVSGVRWTHTTFTASRTVAGNTFSTGAACYPWVIAADRPYVWYRMGEASGVVATDSTSGGRHGTYGAGVTPGQTGALTCQANASAAFTGSSGYVSSSVAAADTWLPVTPLPMARSNHAGASDSDGRIYAIGGNVPGRSAQVDRFDPGTGLWTAIAPLPLARSSLTAATDSAGRIYAIGGSAAGRSAQVDRFDPGTGLWTTLAPLPVARSSLAAATDSAGRIYAIGGFATSGIPSAQVDRFDPGTGLWTSIAPLPQARSGLTAATDSAGRIYAIGGDDTGFVAAQVDRFDPGTGLWTTIAPISGGSDGIAAGTDLTGRIYAFGGADESNRLAQVDRFDPRPQWSNFSVEVWFKTGVAGGRLMGFGDALTGLGITDRNLYLGSTGKVIFGVNNGTKKSIASVSTYKNNAWHLATATMSTTLGMRLYIDGAQVAANAAVLSSTTTAGYWRVGHDDLTGWPSSTAGTFTGQLDEAAVYNKTLTAGQVAAHFAAR